MSRRPSTQTAPGGRKLFPTAWTNFTNFNVPRIAPYFWVGAKYAITPQLDVTGAYYYQQQSDFNTTACTYVNSTFVQPNGNKFVVNRSAATNARACKTPFPP